MAASAGCRLGIPEICDRSQHELLEQSQELIVCTLGMLMLALLTHAIVKNKDLHAVPESLITVLIGMGLGAALICSPLAGDQGTLDSELIQLMFTFLLSTVALPIIIFESGWSLRIRDFVSQFGYIMFFAIFGTIASVIIVAYLLLWTSDHHSVGDWRLAVAFASLISSVDPVSTLATFGHLNVDQLLFILVFGESQINDAVAITLFRSVNESGVGSIATLARGMVEVFSGSVAVGVALAILIILILRFGRMGAAPAQAVLMIFVSCFFTFALGELLTFSGIIAVLFNSIVMGSYAGVHLSSESMALASFLLKQMSSLADTFIFLFSGVMGVFVVMTGGRGFRLGVYLSLFCLVARACAIFPLGVLSNLIKRCVSKRLPKEKDHMISWKHLVMMWHSGLRGGISLVLVTELGQWVDKDVKVELLNATFVMVVFYLLVFGSSTGLLLKCLGVPMGEEVDETETLYTESDRDGWGWRIMMFIRERIMLPLLVGSSTGKERGEDCAEGVVMAALHPGQDLEGHRSPAGVPVDSVDSAGTGATGPAGVPSESRRASIRHWRHSSKNVLLDLFGTADPGHMRTYDDVLGDLRNRRASARGIDDGFEDSSASSGSALSDVSMSDVDVEEGPPDTEKPSTNTI